MKQIDENTYNAGGYVLQHNGGTNYYVEDVGRVIVNEMFTAIECKEENREKAEKLKQVLLDEIDWGAVTGIHIIN